MDTERLSFEEASRELGVTEEELEQLVAAGEIASIKEGDTIYFKKTVVEKFKKTREAGTPTILLSDDDLDLLEDDDSLLSGGEATETAEVATPAIETDKDGRIELSMDDLDLDDIDISATPAAEGAETETKDLSAGKEPAKAASDIADDDTLLSLDGLLEDDAEGTTPVPAAAGGDSDLLDTDDILDIGDLGGESDPFAADTVEEESLTDLTEPGTLLRGGGARVMQMKRKKSHAAWTAVLALSGILLLLPVGILTNLLFIQSPESPKAGIPPADTYGWVMEYNFLDGAVESIADLFNG